MMMGYSRRGIIKALVPAVFGTALAASYGAKPIPNPENQSPPNRILFDMHVHFSEVYSPQILKSILSQGIIGVAEKPNGHAMNLEQVLDALDGNWVEKGLIGSVTYRGKTGYLVKAQEVMAFHHILALFCEGRISENSWDPLSVVDQIHDQGGIAILEHPYIVRSPFNNSRLSKEEEELFLPKLIKKVDEMCVHNGSALRYTPLLMGDANQDAKKLLEYANSTGSHFKGTATTDVHSQYSQIFTSGIYVPENSISRAGLINVIRNGDFTRKEGFISHLQLIQGAAMDIF